MGSISQARRDAMIKKQEEFKKLREENQKQDTILAATDGKILTGKVDFDNMMPETVIRNFCGWIDDIMKQIAYDQDQLTVMNNAMEDIMHYMELSKDQDAAGGYILYRRLTDIRRERRKLKNELEFLRPVCDYFNSNCIVNQLRELQGRCRLMKEKINKRVFTIRTDILNDILDADPHTDANIDPGKISLEDLEID